MRPKACDQSCVWGSAGLFNSELVFAVISNSFVYVDNIFAVYVLIILYLVIVVNHNKVLVLLFIQHA
jgi:hypothetical protein